MITFVKQLKIMFKNAVVWITGASSGIGEETARQFNAAGAMVILSARNFDKLNTIQKSLTYPEKSVIICIDLENLPGGKSGSDSFPELAEQVIKKYGRID